MPGSPEAVRARGNDAGTDDLALEIPADPEQVRTARLFAGSTARHFGLDEETVEDLKVAISEAVTNAIRAHSDADVDAPIRITAVVDDAALRFDVVDQGRAIVPPANDEIDYTPPTGLGASTLGMVVISSLFPSVEITPNAGEGSTVSITIERPPHP